jgi:hypothetical protein
MGVPRCRAAAAIPHDSRIDAALAHVTAEYRCPTSRADQADERYDAERLAGYGDRVQTAGCDPSNKPV